MLGKQSCLILSNISKFLFTLSKIICTPFFKISLELIKEAELKKFLCTFPETDFNANSASLK